MLTDQQSSDKDQTTATDQTSTLDGGREMVETGDHDLEDGDKETSESDQSDVETTNELTTTDYADCQQTQQSYPVMTHGRNTIS